MKNNEQTPAIDRELIAYDVMEAFKNMMSYPKLKLTEDSVIETEFPDMDSLDHIDLVMRLEMKFNIIIDDEDVAAEPRDVNDYSFSFKLKTIREFVDLVIDKLSAKKGELNLN